MQRRHWIGAILLAAAVAAAWLLWTEDAPDQRKPGVVKIVESPPPSPAVSPTAPPVTISRELAGTWSLRDNRGDVRAACDLFSAITYLSGGQYFSNSETGRYAADARSITYSERILIDIDAGEDRSQFDTRETLPLGWTADHAMRIGNRQFYRCEKRES